MINKKIVIGIIIALLFVIAFNFYMKGVHDKQYNEKLAELEILKDKNADLNQEITNLNKEIKELETRIALNIAHDFKRLQFTNDYIEDFSDEDYDSSEEIKEKFSGYVTNAELDRILSQSYDRYVDLLSQETKSDIEMDDITFEITEAVETQIDLDYEIKIKFKPIGQNGGQIISNFGQMRLIKQDEGWKVDADKQQMLSPDEVVEQLDRLKQD